MFHTQTGGTKNRISAHEGLYRLPRKMMSSKIARAKCWEMQLERNHLRYGSGQMRSAKRLGCCPVGRGRLGNGERRVTGKPRDPPGVLPPRELTRDPSMRPQLPEGWNKPRDPDANNWRAGEQDCRPACIVRSFDSKSCLKSCC